MPGARGNGCALFRTRMTTSRPLTVRTATLVMLAVILSLHWPQPAEASVFQNNARRTTSAAGVTVIRVCITQGSSADQDPPLDLASDLNPPLPQVINHVRLALSDAWEVRTSVRFREFIQCEEVPTSELSKYTGLYIHPDASNHAHSKRVGIDSPTDHNVEFNPWGPGFNSCIKFDAGRYQYSFECVEQYAIHEFGHNLGFSHEWLHYNKPQDCTNIGDENAMAAGEAQSSYDHLRAPQSQLKTYTVISPNYDYDSMMAYLPPECATSGFRRFGGANLSSTDRSGVEHIYPAPSTGDYDIGILRGTAPCPGDDVIVFIDDEDVDNKSKAEGWVGSSTVVGGNTRLEFCRVDGAPYKGFLPMTGDRPRSGDYAVLKLGPFCPEGSHWYIRQFDNEDNKNENWLSGAGGPNRDTIGGRAGATELHFCYFRPESFPGDTMARFPATSVGRGVFAADPFGWGSALGSIHTDDEDTNNNNQLLVPPDVGEEVNTGFKSIIETTNNTRLHIAQVGPSTSTPLTVTPMPQTKVYGSPDPTFAFQMTGFLGGEDESVLTSIPTCRVAGEHRNVGTYPITCSGGAAANYTFDTSATASLSVSRATLAVTPANQSRFYGSPDAAFTFDLTGLAAGDTAVSLASSPTCGVAAPHVDAGVYTITCSGGSADNYSIDTTATATLTVTKSGLIVTPDTKSKVYGAADPTFTFQVRDLRGNDDASVLTSLPTCGVTAPHVSAGTYTISCSGGSAANYTVDTTSTATFTVNKAPLTVRPVNGSIVYGAPDPAFTFGLSGFVAGDTASALTAGPTCGVTGAHTNAGTYTITCAGGSAANYSFDTSAAATLVVAKASLAVTPNDGASVYGEPDPAFTFGLSGFVAGDSASVLTSPPTCGVPTPHLNVGSYVIACGGGGATNYTFNTSAIASLVVTPAALTVEAKSETRNFGASNPPLTATLSGFQYGETTTTAKVTGSALCVTTATPSSGVSGSPYPITCTKGTLAAANYTFGPFMAGQLSVTKATTQLVAQDARRGLLTRSMTAVLSRTVDGGGVDGRTVIFSIAGHDICTVTTDASGSATCTRIGIVIGTGTYAVRFGGDADHLAATATGRL